MLLRRLLAIPYLPRGIQSIVVASCSGKKIDLELTEAIRAAKFITDITEMAKQKGKLEDNWQPLSNRLLKDL